jgi:hypothetical protein
VTLFEAALFWKYLASTQSLAADEQSLAGEMARVQRVFSVILSWFDPAVVEFLQGDRTSLELGKGA